MGPTESPLAYIAAVALIVLHSIENRLPEGMWFTIDCSSTGAPVTLLARGHPFWHHEEDLVATGPPPCGANRGGPFAYTATVAPHCAAINGESLARRHVVLHWSQPSGAPVTIQARGPPLLATGEGTSVATRISPYEAIRGGALLLMQPVSTRCTAFIGESLARRHVVLHWLQFNEGTPVTLQAGDPSRFGNTGGAPGGVWDPPPFHG